MDYDALNAIAFVQAKRDWKLRLRQIARAAFHGSRLREVARENLHRGSDRVAVGFRSHQVKPDAPISCQLIVAIEICGTIVCGDEEIDIAIAIEVPVGEATPDFRLIEAAACFCRRIVKTSL